jgi:His-Xaa-Ser system protein HxsD
MPRGQGEGMDTVRVAIDAALFDDDTIARAIHRYTGDFFIEFLRSGTGIEILLTPMRVDVDTTNLPQRFANDLLDERLRAKIRDETSVLHATLVRTALREASPSGPAAESAP